MSIKYSQEFSDYQSKVNSLITLWKDKAFCKGQKAVDFYDSRESVLKSISKQYCSNCPVRSYCLYTSLINEELYGLWGGLTPKQRKSLIKYLKNVASKAGVDHKNWNEGLNEIYKEYSEIEKTKDIYFRSF